MHTNLKKISVVVQTYNQEKFISGCLDSILIQKQDLIGEILILDDFSVDATRDILASYAKKHSLIKLILNATNIGPFASFYKLHSLANFPYIAHIDGDDLWLKGKLEDQFNFLELNPNYSAVACIAEIFDSKKFISIGQFPNKLISTPSINEILSNHPVFILSSLMYKKNPILWGHESKYLNMDWSLFLLLRSIGKIEVLNQSYVIYRHGCGISSNSKTDLTLYELSSINLAHKLGAKTSLCRKKWLKIIARTSIKKDTIYLSPAFPMKPISFLEIIFEITSLIMKKFIHIVWKK
jgi:glycosyltransferase involved in cell wall biosynthesis